jgi:hypothetical protein
MTLESVPAVPLPSSAGVAEGPTQILTPLAAPEPAPRPTALDVLFALFVVVLAFLLASTPARNSDLWLHLAAGRSLVRGQATFGTDPFASTTTGVFWVNHSWLSDALLYAIHELGDGRALVIAKAVLVAGLAGLFLCFRRRGDRLGIVALAAAAAILALGPWLVLQPVLFSLLGVVLTLYLLERPSLTDGSRAERARSQRWLLVPLFALWANFDTWFLLGPALVGLYAVGEGLSYLVADRRLSPLAPPGRGVEGEGRSPEPLTPDSSPRSTGARGVSPSAGFARPGELRTLVLLTLGGLAACFLTPYHYHTLALPTPLGLSHVEQALMRDPLGHGLVVSPFTTPYATAPAFASAGGWAYCLLLTAGLASFALRGRALHPGRLLAWLALAALSLYQARAIPFFAVAAGPMLALNLQEWARTTAPSIRVRRLQAAARGVGVLAGLALLVLAWPGWLQPAPYNPRAWTVEQDESLVRLAQTLNKWHEDRQFRPDRCALTFSPEVAHYLAWFCPSEKGFLDSRWPLFDEVADDYVGMRRALLRPEGPGSDPALGLLLDVHRIDRIILHDSDFGRTSRAFRGLLSDGNEWELLAIQGSAVLFGRRTGAESSSPWKPLDLRRPAYHPEADLPVLPEAARAPEPSGPFDPFYRIRDDRSSNRAEAALYLIYFDLLADRARAQLGTQWLTAQATGLLGSGSGSEPAGTAIALAVRLSLTPLLPASSSNPPPPSEAEGMQRVGGQLVAGFMATRDRGPPDALLLAVRAARRALSTNPDDAGAFLFLGEAYLRLATQTRELSWQTALPLLGPIRRGQALTALEQAVLLRPDLDAAHALLAQLYFEQGQMDRALDHLRARLRIAEREMATGGPDVRSAGERRSILQHDVEALEGLVRHSETIYAANTEGKTALLDVVERARLAARHGLTRKSLEMLLQSYPAIFGKTGTQMQLELMLKSGRAYEVRAWLEPKHEELLDYSLFHSLQAQAAAACGDYAAADAELNLLSVPLRQAGVSGEQVLPVREAVALQVGGAVLAGPVFGAGPAGLASSGFQQFEVLRPVGGAVSLLGQEADSEVLRGLLALESGAVGVARGHFRAALEVWKGDDAAAAGAGVDFRARPIAQYEMRLLEENIPH